MKNKFWYLTKVSLKKKIASKWFVIVNIILALTIIALTNINSIITFFGGDFNEETNIIVIDTSGKAYDIFFNNFTTITKEEERFSIEQKTGEIGDIKGNLTDDEILIILEDDNTNYLKAQMITNKKMDNITYQLILQSLNNTKSTVAMMENGIDSTLLTQISTAINIERIVMNEERSIDENMELIMSTVFPILILPFFMLTIFLVQMVGGEICEEKTTKSMEIIISNVSPKIHLGSKILASNIFVIGQAILLFIYLLFGLAIGGMFSGGFNVPMEITSIWTTLIEAGFIKQFIKFVPLMLSLFMMSFLAYSLVAGILASMTTNMEDFQQIQTPIMLISLASYYLAMMAGMFEGSVFIKILSYIPFLSCLVSPSLFMMGQVGMMDVIISILILALFIFVLVKYGLRIYKVGILNYSNEKVWKRLFKAVKTKDM